MRHRKANLLVTVGLKSYPSAMRDLGNIDRRAMGRWLHNLAEKSYLPFRQKKRAMFRFRQIRSPQKLAAVLTNVHYHFNWQHHPNNPQFVSSDYPPA